MDKTEYEFEEWFGVLQCYILDEIELDFKDTNAVRPEYDKGRDVYDLADEIIAEYKQAWCRRILNDV